MKIKSTPFCQGRGLLYCYFTKGSDFIYVRVTKKIRTFGFFSASYLNPAWDGNCYPNFQSYAKAFSANLLPLVFVQQFAALLTTSTSPIYQPGLSLAQATAMARQLGNMPISGHTLSQLFTSAMLGHYAGDYKPDAATQSIYEALAGSSNTYLKILGGYLKSVGNMDNPNRLGDNNLDVNFTTATLYTPSWPSAAI